MSQTATTPNMLYSGITEIHTAMSRKLRSLVPILLAVAVFTSTSLTTYATTGPIGIGYTMQFDGQWNPPYAAGAEPVVHVGATIANITPTPPPGPLTNITAYAVGVSGMGSPTTSDIPPNFTVVDTNTAAERIGTTVVLASFPLLSVSYNTPIWLRNQIIDAEGHTLTMYTFYPDGLTGDDSQDVTTYNFVNNQIIQLVIPHPSSSGTAGSIVSFTVNDVRFLGNIVTQNPAVSAKPSASDQARSLADTGQSIGFILFLAAVFIGMSILSLKLTETNSLPR